MPHGLTSTLRLFADDTIVYMTVTSTSDDNALQSDLDKLAIWEKWKMVFHPQKCNVITITRKRSPIKYSYSLHRQILENSTISEIFGL